MCVCALPSSVCACRCMCVWVCVWVHTCMLDWLLSARRTRLYVHCTLTHSHTHTQTRPRAHTHTLYTMHIYRINSYIYVYVYKPPVDSFTWKTLQVSQVSNWNYLYGICDLKNSSQSAKCSVLSAQCSVLVRIAVETSPVELLSAALAGPLIELLPKPGNSHRCTLFPTTRAHMWQLAFQFELASHD